MAAVVVDTHAAVWYLLNAKSLSDNAQRAMDDAAKSGDPVALDGETLAIATLDASQIRPVQRREITHARLLRA